MPRLVITAAVCLFAGLVSGLWLAESANRSNLADLKAAQQEIEQARKAAQQEAERAQEAALAQQQNMAALKSRFAAQRKDLENENASFSRDLAAAQRKIEQLAASLAEHNSQPAGPRVALTASPVAASPSPLEIRVADHHTSDTTLFTAANLRVRKVKRDDHYQEHAWQIDLTSRSPEVLRTCRVYVRWLDDAGFIVHEDAEWIEGLLPGETRIVRGVATMTNAQAAKVYEVTYHLQ